MKYAIIEKLRLQYPVKTLCNQMKLSESGKLLLSIANDMDHHVSTVSRELSQNTGLRGYRYEQAEKRSLSRQRGKSKIRISQDIWDLVKSRICKDYSPEQISGDLAKQGFSISHERIYPYILADKKRDGNIHSHLRCQRKNKRRYGKADKRGQIQRRICIDERPAVINEKSRFGDWEADTVEGCKESPVLVTLAERKSRLYFIGKAADKKATEVTRVIKTLLTPIKDFVQSITYDNGKEFIAITLLFQKSLKHLPTSLTPIIRGKEG